MGKPNIEKMKAKKDVEGLMKLLQHEDEDIQFEAALSLGKIGDARAVESLIQALNAKSSEVRWRAALSLGEIGDPRAINPLRKTLKEESNEVHRYSAEALGMLGEIQEYLSALETELFDSSDSYRMSTAAEKLASFGDKGMSVLLKAMISKNQRIMHSAARAIYFILMKEGKKSDKDLQVTLEPAIQHLTRVIDDAEIRRGTARSFDEYTSAAIAALGFIGDSSAIPVLERLLSKVKDMQKIQGVIRQYVRTDIAAGYISTEDDIAHVGHAIERIRERSRT